MNSRNDSKNTKHINSISKELVTKDHAKKYHFSLIYCIIRMRTGVERGSERKRERKTRSQKFNSQGWVRPRPGAKNSVWVSHTGQGSRSPSTESRPAAPSRDTSRKLASEEKLGRKPRHPNLRWGILATSTNTHPPKAFLMLLIYLEVK